MRHATAATFAAAGIVAAAVTVGMVNADGATRAGHSVPPVEVTTPALPDPADPAVSAVWPNPDVPMPGFHQVGPSAVSATTRP